MLGTGTKATKPTDPWRCLSSSWKRDVSSWTRTYRDNIVSVSWFRVRVLGEWMDGWVSGWVDGCVGRWMGMDGWMVGGWVDGWMDDWMDGWMNE